MAVSTKPYLVRAIYEWCVDSGYRPFIAVAVDSRTMVPREFVRNGEIVLNISTTATNRLQIGNELVEFEARFGGVARHVSIPVENVTAIFAQETGHGMAFEAPKAQAHAEESAGEAPHAGDDADTDPGIEEQESAAASGATEDGPPDTGAEPAAAAAGEADAEPGSGGARRPKRSRKAPLREAKSDESSPNAPAGAAVEAAPGTDGAGEKTAAERSRARGKPKLAAVPRAADAPKAARKRGEGAGEEGTPGEAQAEAKSTSRRRSPIAAVPSSGKRPGTIRSSTDDAPSGDDDDRPEPTPPSPRKPKLTRVK